MSARPMPAVHPLRTRRTCCSRRRRAPGVRSRSAEWRPHARHRTPDRRGRADRSRLGDRPRHTATSSARPDARIARSPVGRGQETIGRRANRRTGRPSCAMPERRRHRFQMPARARTPRIRRHRWPEDPGWLSGGAAGGRAAPALHVSRGSGFATQGASTVRRRTE